MIGSNENIYKISLKAYVENLFIKKWDRDIECFFSKKQLNKAFLKLSKKYVARACNTYLADGVKYLVESAEIRLFLSTQHEKQEMLKTVNSTAVCFYLLV